MNNNYYLVYLVEDEVYDIFSYYELNDMRSKDYKILYEGEFEACDIYLTLV